MRQWTVPLVLALLAAPLLAGCLTTSDEPVDPGTTPGATGRFDTSQAWSMPLSPALYDILPPVQELVPSFDGTPISVAYVLPEVPEGTRVPVVMESGPYFAGSIDSVKYRPPLVDWLVPRGYAVVYMSVRGTGESGGCMEFMSTKEQLDVDFILNWVANQSWSDGNIGMIGRSYDGTTPLMGAALGNPHLKTIVPISGVTSQRDLMFKNGTSEVRGPIMHSVVYWANYGLGLADGGVGIGEGGVTGHRVSHWTEQACEEFLVGSAEGVVTTATGQAASDYWVQRDFKSRIIDNYNGSIWIIHGLEDWNVNPSQVVPWFNDLQDAGKDVKIWLGVWGHAYPDRVDEHRNVRWDWAERLVQWFDKHLKGIEGIDTGPAVEVEDSLFVWRGEASYPPRDATWLDVPLEGNVLVAANSPGFITTEPFEQPVRIAGLPRLHFQATPTTATGGYLFAELYDVFPDGRTYRIGWGAINLRYHDGGNTEPATLVPGQAVTVKMEFEPMDALVAAGHRLQVVLQKDGVEDILPSPDPSPVLVDERVLSLPVVDRPTIIPTYVPPGMEE